MKALTMVQVDQLASNGWQRIELTFESDGELSQIDAYQDGHHCYISKRVVKVNGNYFSIFGLVPSVDDANTMQVEMINDLLDACQNYEKYCEKGTYNV